MSAKKNDRPVALDPNLTVFAVPVDVWQRFIIPKLRACDAMALTRVSKRFLYLTSRFWRDRARIYLQPFTGTDGTLDAMPSDSTWWRKLNVNCCQSITRPRLAYCDSRFTPYRRYALTECTWWRKSKRESVRQAISTDKAVGVNLSFCGPLTLTHDNPRAVTTIGLVNSSRQYGLLRIPNSLDLGIIVHVLRSFEQPEPMDGFLVHYNTSEDVWTSRCHPTALSIEAIRRWDPATNPRNKEYLDFPHRPILLYTTQKDWKKEQNDILKFAERIGADAFVDCANQKGIDLAFQMIAELVRQYYVATHLVTASPPISPQQFYDKSDFANPATPGPSSLLHHLMNHPDGTTELVQRILDASPPHVLSWCDAEGRTPLHLLVASSEPSDIQRRRKLLRLLLSRGADPTMFDYKRQTPLSVSASTEFHLLLIGFLGGKLKWIDQPDGTLDWEAYGPFPKIAYSNEKICRNGKIVC